MVKFPDPQHCLKVQLPKLFTTDFSHESAGFHSYKYAENCGNEALKLRTSEQIAIAGLRLRSNISWKVAELRLQTCFLQVAEFRLRTQKIVALAHLCKLWYVHVKEHLISGSKFSC